MSFPGYTTVVIDTETTGFGHMDKEPRQDAVIQVGIAFRGRYSNELVSKEWLCMPKPHFLGEWGAEALKVNNITEEELLKAPYDHAVAFELKRVLDNLGPKILLRSYNMAFDRPFLDVRPWSLGKYPWGECIMEETMKALKAKKWLKLKDACYEYGIATDGPLHSAGYDAIIAYQLMEAIESTQKLPLEQ